LNSGTTGRCEEGETNKIQKDQSVHEDLRE
jgi:hypothetical protein